ncbi:50S ribosomal protein L11, partial [Candidatus Microgenomates bacterium]
NLEKVGKLTKEQVETIAKEKLPDLNTEDIDQAKRVVAGTARSMGIDVET